MFLRFSSSAKIIVYAWVNDSETLRAYGTKSGAYAMFKGMLEKGHPPEDWAKLLGASAAMGGGLII